MSPTPSPPQVLFLAEICAGAVAAALVQSVLAALVQAHHRYALSCAAGVCAALAWAGVAVWAIATGVGLQGLGLALLAQQLVAIVILAPAAAVHLHFRKIGLLSRSEFRQVAGFSIRRQLFGITTRVNNQFDVFIIAAVLPLGLVGLYWPTGANFAMQLRGVLSNALVPMGNDITYTYGREGQQAADRRLILLQKTWVVAVTGFFAVALGAAYWGIYVWLGRDIRSLGSCNPYASGSRHRHVLGALTLYLNAIGKPGAEARYGMIAMALDVALTVPLVLLAGVYGVVAGTVSGMVIGTLILVPLARSGTGLAIPHFIRDVPVVPTLVSPPSPFSFFGSYTEYSHAGRSDCSVRVPYQSFLWPFTLFVRQVHEECLRTSAWTGYRAKPHMTDHQASRITVPLVEPGKTVPEARPRVLAVVVSWNSAEYVVECIKSLVSSCSPADSLLVDNCSDDRTVALVEAEFPSVRVVQTGSTWVCGCQQPRPPFRSRSRLRLRLS